MDRPTVQEPLTARGFNPRVGAFGEPRRIIPTTLRLDFTAPDTNYWTWLMKPITSP